jgi:DNA-3-methyladenine glycosylase I
MRQLNWKQPKTMTSTLPKTPKPKAIIPDQSQDGLTRCPWCESKTLDRHYHDTEWGVPMHNDRDLLELLTLEGAQAGLSWSTVLAKREGYKRVFKNFDPKKIAAFTDADIDAAMIDTGIVRNKLKILSTIGNAKALLAVQKKYGSFDAFLWQIVGGKPIVNTWKAANQVPAKTAESDAMSKMLLSHGFKFVGSTICYAFMQASGMVNDHLVGCYRHKEVLDK